MHLQVGNGICTICSVLILRIGCSRLMLHGLCDGPASNTNACCTVVCMYIAMWCIMRSMLHACHSVQRHRLLGLQFDHPAAVVLRQACWALDRGSLAFAWWRASQETSCRVVKPFVQRHVPERVPLHVPPLASGPSSVEHEMIDDWYYVAAGTCWEWASGCSLVDAMQQHKPEAAVSQLQHLST